MGEISMNFFILFAYGFKHGFFRSELTDKDRNNY